MPPLLVALLLMVSPVARAQESERPAARAQTTLKNAARPEAVIELLELYDDYDLYPPEQTQAALQRLVDDRRLPPPLQVLSRRLLAQVHAHRGQQAAAEEAFDALGYLGDFRVIGPFDNDGKAGLSQELAPERDRMLAPDPHASFPGKERPVAWREVPEDTGRGGQVPLFAMLRPTKKVCAFAETFLELPRAETLSLWFGAGGASVVYWNGAEIMRDEVYRQRPFADRSASLVAAVKGWNRLLIKVCVDDEPLAFHVRLGDRRGGVVRPLQVSPNTEKALDITAGTVPRGQTAPLSSLVALEERASRRAASPADKLALARFLAATGSDASATRRAKQLSAEAARAKPSPEALAFAESMARERGDKIEFVRLAEEKFPGHPVSLLLKAQLLATGPVPEDALGPLSQVPERTNFELSANALRGAIFGELGLPGAAYRQLKELGEHFSKVPAYLRLAAVMADRASHRDEGIALREQLLGLRADDVAARRTLLSDALSRSEDARVEEHLDALRAQRPFDLANLRYIAEMYDALGRDDMSLATYREAMELSPDHAPLRFSYAQALLRAQQSDLAAAALEDVLRLSPQHAQARELLEQLKPRVRRDERFATASDMILSRRSDGQGHSTTVLHQLQVNTVFDNGLGTRFTQIAAQAHDEEGARSLRAQSIQFDPATQRVDLRLARVYRKDGRQLESIRVYEQQLGEPWYRIYYDTRALTVVFPDLQPGDVVELRYRVDDIAQRNLFADYYGDMHMLAGASPSRHHEYVLITPEGRTFYTNQPNMPGLQLSERSEDGKRIRSWVAKDVPAILAESGMPGLTELSPYLHVSTYKTWEDVGRWYWGLIHEQLYADVALKAKVAELTAGKTTTVDKVKAIHDWVIDHTRYVGLEFGIHGFLPYRVPLIVQRGFGDCKDKASLLYTMFREAGIDARIVLVRTRRNGAITDLPASLAVFDHAIAYVPELDLFIDGTAEFSGTTELPPQDQGVTVLVVGPKEAQLRKTPVLPPESHSRSRTMEIVLDEKGDGDVHASEVLVGSEAASYRSHYEAVGTRRERFERALSGLYPGLHLTSLEMSDLSDREAPVKVDYRFSAPTLAKRDGQTLRVSLTGLRDLTRVMASTPTRLHALDLQTRSLYEESRTYTVPNGLVSTLPEGGNLSSPFFDLSVQVTREGNEVRAVTRFVIKKDRVEAQEYSAFRKDVVLADRILRQRIVLSPTAQASAPATTSALPQSHSPWQASLHAPQHGTSAGDEAKR